MASVKVHMHEIAGQLLEWAAHPPVDRWEAHDARCGMHPEGQQPFLGYVYVNSQFGAGYFAQAVKLGRGSASARAVLPRPQEGFPLARLAPGSRTWLRPPGKPLHGWFETTCPWGHVVGATAGSVRPGPREVVYLFPR